MKKSLDEIVAECQEDEKICMECGLEMKLITHRKKKNRWNKGHFTYECSCGNKFRKRTVNEILRDMGEKE